MADLCTACLCSERNLSDIGDTDLFQVYLQILNEIPVYGSHLAVQLCWECCHLLAKFQRFKDEVKSSYLQLLQCSHEGLESTKHLIKTPHLQIKHNVISIDFPDIKLEYDALYFNSDLLDQNVDDNFEHFEQTVGQPLSHQYDDGLSQADDDEKVKEENWEDSALLDHDNEKVEMKDKIEVEVEMVENLKPPKTKNKTKKAKYKLKKPIKVKKKRELRQLMKLKSKNSVVENGDSTVDIAVKEDEDKCNIEIVERDDNNVYEKGDMWETKTFELPQVTIRRLPKSKARDAPSEKPQCAECGKVFSSRKTLKYHLNVLHKGNNKYPCPQCGKVYQWKSNLGRHIRSHKAREKDELYCATCDKRFASVATYRQHLSISKQHVSESEFNFTCDECGKKFVNKTRLRDHIDWEHLQRIKFRCQLCNKPFKCHTSLYVHMNNVHTNKGLKDNLCHVCGKSYQNRAKLRYHIVAMHTSETPYQCEQCSAAFGWYSSLYRHVREVHYKMKIHASKSKRSKKKLDLLPPMEAPQLVLPSIPHEQTHTQPQL